MDICQGIRITDSPFKETHSFATISRVGDEQGFRVLMSRAGDWTSNFIDNPPTRIWVKGAPIYGVMRVALMFKKVLVVATGTGIGPCLSLLESCPEHPMHVLWMGSNPRQSFGDTIINSVYTADSGACIVDTSRAGRGDILRLAYARYVESQSEAIVIISNANVTRLVVGGLEHRGIPVFGAIFDS
jgi:NAD(P)H-flavin reductase